MPRVKGDVNVATLFFLFLLLPFSLVHMTEVEARLWPVAQFATNQLLIQGLSIQERDSDKGGGGGGGAVYYRTIEGRTRGGGRG